MIGGMRAEEALLSMLPEAELRVGGDSMAPAFRDGDRLAFAPAAAGSLIPGEVVCFRSGGRALVHRLLAVRRTPAGPRFLCKGDNCLLPDPEFGPEDLLGRVTAACGRPLRPAPWLARLSRWQGAFQVRMQARPLGRLKARLIPGSLLLGLLRALGRLA